MTDSPPKVFVSHASEDKPFVLELANTLRAQLGVDAWVDTWEIKDGDSLVQKIFDAIGEAETVVVMCSKKSVDKPWVREEIDAAFMQRIEGKCRIIPVKLGKDVEMPVALKATKRLSVEKRKDRSAIPDLANQLARTIHGIEDKPEIGPRPSYADATAIPGLAKQDSLVLITLGDEAISGFDEGGVPQGEYRKRLQAKLSALAISDQGVVDSLEMLESHGCVATSYGLGGRSSVATFHAAKLEQEGLRLYLEAKGFDLPKIRQHVVLDLANRDSHPMVSAETIAAEIGVHPVVVDHICDELVSRGLIVTFQVERTQTVSHTTAGVRRLASEYS